jgi:hypothetical protein
MAATYEKIATTTLGSAAATITLSSIPATYTDLRLVLTYATTSGGDTTTMKLNGTTTGYSETRLLGNGANASSYAGTNMSNFEMVDAATSTTIPDFISVDIFSYAGSTNKTILSNSSQDRNGSGKTMAIVGLWRNVAALTSVTFGFVGADTFATGATATLYGILKA